LRKTRLAVIGSTNGTDLQAIIDAIGEGKLNASVEIVISNIANAYILERAKNHQIPNFYISHKNKSRVSFENEITTQIKMFKVDLILLIGFMRILSGKFCQDWSGIILNVHPSLLPKYSGKINNNIHEEVIKNGDRETGCTVHWVTEDVDQGKILIQKKCMVEKNDNPLSLKAKVQKLEGEALIEAIKIFNN